MCLFCYGLRGSDPDYNTTCRLLSVHIALAGALCNSGKVAFLIVFYFPIRGCLVFLLWQSAVDG